MQQPAFQDEGHLKAWLIRVTVNQCRDLKKSFWSRHTVVLSEEQWAPLEKDRQEVFVELWKLPKDYRNVIYLYYYEGYKISEIAQMLGKSENTVGSWMTRARKQLKSLLDEGGGE